MKIKDQCVFRSPDLPRRAVDHPIARPVPAGRGSSDVAGERGYVLLAIMLMMTLMILALTIEAPRIAQQIKREKEEELIHRGNEYKSAIRKYFRKFGQYPLSLDQLQNTNNMRFLRRRYKDPFTGKDDWRLLHPGEVQLNVANGGTNTPGQPSGQLGSSIGQPSGQQFGGNIGQPAAVGVTTPPNAQPNQPGQPGADPSASGATPGSNNAGITPASSMPGASSNSPVIGGGPVIGVSSTSKLKSIKVRDGKDHYNDWPFFYDPRLDQQTLGAGVQAGPGINPAGGPAINPIGGPTSGPTNTPQPMTQPRMNQ